MAEKSEEKTASKEKSESSWAGLMNFVPSAYYDLIARVCPGMAFWVAIASMKFHAATTTESTKIINELSGPQLFVLLILSYISGIALTGFSVVWDAISIWILKFNSTVADKIFSSSNNGWKFTDLWGATSLKIDQVLKKSDEAGRLLFKGLAEVTLCQNLLTGLIVLMCIGWASAGTHFYNPWDNYAWVYFLLIEFTFFVSMVFRQAMFLGRIKNIHEIYFSDADTGGTIKEAEFKTSLIAIGERIKEILIEMKKL